MDGSQCIHGETKYPIYRLESASTDCSTENPRTVFGFMARQFVKFYEFVLEGGAENSTSDVVPIHAGLANLIFLRPPKGLSYDATS